MAETFKVRFMAKAAIGMAMYELNARFVSHSEYSVHVRDWVIYHASANVVDVITESLNPHSFKIEEEQE